jgi:alanine racemase
MRNDAGRVSRRALLAGAALAAVARHADALPRVGPRSPEGPDPWLEIAPGALAHNVEALRRMSGGRPILAVVKNNAYGLGLDPAGPLLDRLDGVWGLAVVRGDEARAVREAGVRKPVLVMGPVAEDEALELVRQDVRLAPFAETEARRLMGLAARLGRPVPVHLYVDTGMHRMGMPLNRVLEWLATPGLLPALAIEGAFTELTEDQDLGRLHAASSDAIVSPTPETFLDLVRPGLTLYGGYPTEASRARGELRPAYRLKARVIRLDRLEAGEGVSYHRRWTAERPTWTATLGIGHVDGYPAGAVRGCEVLIRGELHPVVGTVSASHTVVALGAETAVEVGDEATLVGPDRPALHPNEVARRSGWSEYNMFMHLNPLLPKRVITE